MRDNAWGKDPFDLRLTVLRMIRRLPAIMAVAALLTILLGGGYYLKNVTFRQKTYIASTTFSMEYADENWAVNNTFINEYTWNVWVKTDEFLGYVKDHLSEVGLQEKALGDGMSASVPSDLRMVTISFASKDAAQANRVMEAVGVAMTEDFSKGMKDVAAIRVIDVEAAAENLKTVKPVRAIVLAAVIGLFTGVMLFLFLEILFERIWLPESLSSRFGMKNAGIPRTELFWENLKYFFDGKKRVAICPANQELDPKEIADKLQKKGILKDVEWIPVPCPTLTPSETAKLREMDGILLAVNAGEDVKHLQAILDFLTSQDCKITAATLWNEDTWLLKSYYTWNYLSGPKVAE